MFVGILILILPTAFAVYFYNVSLEEERSRERLVSVSVTDPEGKAFVYDTDDANTFALLKAITALTEKSDRSVSELESSGKTFSLEYTTTHATYLCKVFVVKGDTGYLSYFSYGDFLYSVDAKNKNSFLSSEFALSVYDASSIPTLSVNGTEMNAITAEWHIKMANGDFAKVEGSSDKTSVDKYTSSSSPVFSNAPDSYTVTVTGENGNELFKGDSYAFAAFEFTRSKRAEVKIEAVWYQTPNGEYYGNAVYVFDTYFEAAPEFHLSSYDAFPGSALLLSCINFPEDVSVSATISPSLCNVDLYRDGMNLYTFIPISYNAAPGTYTLTVTYRNENKQIPFTVSKKTYSTSNPISQGLISYDKVEQCLSEISVEEYKTLLSDVAKTESGKLYYDGRLEDYQKLFNLYKGFGYTLPFDGSDKITRNDGVYFTARVGSTLTAMGDGVVCAVGESAYLGKYLVIDHGYGLRSWYVTLGTTALAQGAEVKKGDPVGTSGNTGLALSGKLLVMVTVADVPVSPYQFWENDNLFVK